MTEKVYTVYDSKAEAWLRPFHMRTKGEAMRSYTEVCNDPKSEFSKYPEDYCLYEIGEWDVTQGIYHMYETKHNIGLASQFKRPENQLNLFDKPKPLQAEGERLN